MPTIGNRFFTALEICDFPLDHSTITSALNVTPTFQQGRGVGPERNPPRRDLWIFRSRDFAFDDYNGVAEFCMQMDRIPKKGFDEIRKISDVKLYVVVETTDKNFEFRLPIALLKSAVRLDIEIDIDNYVFSKSTVRKFLQVKG
jgi:hypothetical protein